MEREGLGRAGMKREGTASAVPQTATKIRSFSPSGFASLTIRRDIGQGPTTTPAPKWRNRKARGVSPG